MSSHSMYKYLCMSIMFLHKEISVDLFSSVQFSHSVVSASSRPHELQQARPPCPSPAAGVYLNPHPLSQ